MRVETSGKKFGKRGASVSCSGYSVYACSETVIELERTPTFNCDQDCSVRSLTVGHRCRKWGRDYLSIVFTNHIKISQREQMCVIITLYLFSSVTAAFPPSGIKSMYSSTPYFSRTIYTIKKTRCTLESAFLLS